MDKLRLPVKARVGTTSEEKLEMDLPVVPPHLLAAWLLETGRISLNADSARRFWTQHRERQTPWMEGQDFVFEQCQPFAIYGDEAEYTVTKEKILVIFGRYLGV